MKHGWEWVAAAWATAIIAIVANAARVSSLGVKDAWAGENLVHGKIFVLMVWDGLRPDLVDEGKPANLVVVGGAGVPFARHYSIYPTLTMVDAAGLATGAAPGGSGIF